MGYGDDIEIMAFRLIVTLLLFFVVFLLLRGHHIINFSFVMPIEVIMQNIFQLNGPYYTGIWQLQVTRWSDDTNIVKN